MVRLHYLQVELAVVSLLLSKRSSWTSLERRKIEWGLSLLKRASETRLRSLYPCPSVGQSKILRRLKNRTLELAMKLCSETKGSSCSTIKDLWGDNSLIDKIEYMALMGCKYLVLDHITIASLRRK